MVKMLKRNLLVLRGESKVISMCIYYDCENGIQSIPLEWYSNTGHTSHVQNIVIHKIDHCVRESETKIGKSALVLHIYLKTSVASTTSTYDIRQ